MNSTDGPFVKERILACFVRRRIVALGRLEILGLLLGVGDVVTKQWRLEGSLRNSSEALQKIGVAVPRFGLNLSRSDTVYLLR
jgi:hypothetical protein